MKGSLAMSTCVQHSGDTKTHRTTQRTQHGMVRTHAHAQPYLEAHRDKTYVPHKAYNMCPLGQGCNLQAMPCMRTMHADTSTVAGL